MKKTTFLLAMMAIVIFACNPKNGKENEKAIKAPSQAELDAEINTVKSHMKKYKETLESLDVTESYALFTFFFLYFQRI